MSTRQEARVLALLQSRIGEWIPAEEVAQAGGLQYSARLHALRHERGYEIESRVERVHGVTRRSWFRLWTKQQSAAFAIGRGEKPKAVAKNDEPNLFGDIAPTHRDDG